MPNPLLESGCSRVVMWPPAVRENNLDKKLSSRHQLQQIDCLSSEAAFFSMQATFTNDGGMKKGETVQTAEGGAAC